ncbi:F-box/kelch-repeat protein At3g06240-like [Pyrus x bretschneideri]|uniref:F-box/kelch-repeat protein At3g06240-like n=1 Tax=Pyrus x bretschneideri TaxID=225117 RepID=UPI00202F7233|nr:F-box/kelch-repeat protein At3g06240-like [Pyrus x bretschneideri]
MSQVRESETPEDRVVETLSRLPPKSLMRFKCIRKSWCTLINTPSFVAKHLNNSMNNKLSTSTCILLNRCQNRVFPDRSWKPEVFWSMINLSIDSDDHNLHYDVEDVNIPCPLEGHDFVEIGGYCNGIVCVLAWKTLHWIYVILCNPATGEFRQLPHSCLLQPSRSRRKFQLNTISTLLGFGYDCKAKEYKVVQVIENCEYSDAEQYDYHRIALPHTAEVYTTTANSWREIKIDISSETYCYTCSVYLNGFCYWIATDEENFILSFDLGEEIFHRIQLPSRRESDFQFSNLFLCNKSIASFGSCYNPSDEDSTLYEIWVMDDYDGVKSSWTKLLTFGPLKGIENLFTFWKTDELLMETSGGTASSYNSSTGNLNYLHIPPILNQVRAFKALIYVESIVPIK